MGYIFSGISHYYYIQNTLAFQLCFIRRYYKIRYSFEWRSSIDEYINVVKYLNLFTFVDPMFDYQIVEDDELPEKVQGETDVINHIIRIKQSIR